MAGTCDTCGRYLGSSTACPDCGPPEEPSPADEWATTGGFPPPDVDISPAPTAGSAASFEVRGFVIEGEQIRLRYVPGTIAVRLGLVALWGCLVYAKALDLVTQMFWNLFWTALPVLVVVVVVAALASKIGLGGCLTAAFQVSLFSREPSAGIHGLAAGDRCRATRRPGGGGRRGPTSGRGPGACRPRAEGRRHSACMARPGRRAGDVHTAGSGVGRHPRGRDHPRASDGVAPSPVRTLRSDQ